MVNNYWCDVSKISLVFYYLNSMKGALAAAAFTLKLLLSKCLQCNYIHTLMTEKCARKEKRKKNQYFCWVWALVLWGMKGKGDFWANTVENSYCMNIPIYSWACCREDEAGLVLEVQNCTSETQQCPLHRGLSLSFPHPVLPWTKPLSSNQGSACFQKTATTYMHKWEASIKTLSFICIISAKNIFMG